MSPVVTRTGMDILQFPDSHVICVIVNVIFIIPIELYRYCMRHGLIVVYPSHDEIKLHRSCVIIIKYNMWVGARDKA